MKIKHFGITLISVEVGLEHVHLYSWIIGLLMCFMCYFPSKEK